MNFADFLLPAAALAATTLTGGAAAPVVAGLEGAAATGTALGTTALGSGAAEALAASQAASAAAGAGEMAGVTGAGLSAAPSGAPGLTSSLGSGWSGIMNPSVDAGLMASAPTPAMPLGMQEIPGAGALQGAPQVGQQALGTGLSGTGAFAEIPGAAGTTSAGPVAPAKPGLSVQQMGQLAKLVGGDQQQQARPVGGGGGGVAPPNRAPNMASVSAPGVSARPSLAQLLYGRK